MSREVNDAADSASFTGTGSTGRFGVVRDWASPVSLDLRYNLAVLKRKPESAASSAASAPSSSFRVHLRRFFRRFVGDRSPVLESVLGRLELQVLEALWARPGSLSVRDLHEGFPDLAYTTLMTTLDRLHKKGILERRKQGRAYLYSPGFTRKELESYVAEDALDTLLGPLETDASIRPVLSSFVEAVSRRDELLLDELEELIRDKKTEFQARAGRGTKR